MAVLVNSVTLLARPSPEKGESVYGFSANVPKIHGLWALRGMYGRVLASTRNAISRQDQSSVPSHHRRTPNWFGDMDAELKDAFIKFRERPDRNVGRELIKRLCRVTKTGKAIEVVEIMLRASIVPDHASCTELVVHLCYRGNVWFAMQFIERMEEIGLEVNPKAYNTVLKALCEKRGWWDKILGWLDRYVEKGLVLHNFARSCLLGIICKVRGVDEAMMFLDEMIANKGWEPEMWSYNVILTGLCHNGRSYEAIRLLDDLTSKGLSPNVYSYNIPLLNLCEKGEWLEAKKLLAKMDAMGVLRSPSTYKIIIARLAYHGKIEEALQYLDEMMREPLVPNTGIYNPIIQQLCKECKVDYAVSCINQMISHNCYPDDGTYKAIAKLCEWRKVEDAFSIIQFLERKQNSSSHYFYKGVISALCRRGETCSAVELLYEMVCNGFKPDSYTYAALIRGLSLEGKLDKAVEIVRLLEEFHWRLDTEIFNALVEGFSKAGRMLRSLEFFELMLEKGCKPDEMTYTYIVQGMFEAGEEELASELVQELLQRNVISNETIERLSLKYHLE